MDKPLARPQTLAFAGTPEFAQAALAALHQAGHPIALVLTQPDRPAGRGMQLQASPVKQYALQHGMTVAQPRSLKLDGQFADQARAGQAAILAAREAGAVGLVVAAYGLILPQWVLDVFAPAQLTGGLGCLNIHASLLPRWRGAAPIHRAIESGDTHTGITVMQMDAGLDTGDMLLARATPIGTTETTGQLHDRLAQLGGESMLAVLRAACEGPPLHPTPQPRAQEAGAERITYAAKIDKGEALIDWSLPAVQIARRVRAFNPAPGASTAARGEIWKIWAAETQPAAAPGSAMQPGQVMAVGPDGIVVATGEGALRATQLQRPGGKRLAAADFLRGVPVQVGERLG